MHRPSHHRRRTASIELLLLHILTLTILLVISSVHPQAARTKPSADLERSAAWKYRQGDYDSAIADLTQAIKDDPHSATLYGHRGAVKLVKGDARGAVEDYSSALTIDPTRFSVFWERGDAKAILHDQIGAMADFDEAIRLSPQFAPAIASRGSLNAESGDMTGALADLNRALALDPKNYQYLTDRGSVHDSQGEHRDAIADYEQSIALNSNYPGSLNNLAWDYATAPDLDAADRAKAVGLATRACEQTNWKDAASLDTLAAAYAAVGKYDDAIKWERAALAVWPADGPQIPEANARLALYQNHQPYLMPSPAIPSSPTPSPRNDTQRQ